MAISYETIRRWAFPVIEQRHDVRDVLLYAATLGLGEDPLDARHLRFLQAEAPRVFPTFAVTVGYPGLWMRDPAAGIDWRRMVHAEQRMRLHRELLPAETLTARHEVTHVTDKGAGKGALVVVRRRLTDAAGHEVAELEQTSFCRGDGGFGAGDTPPEALPACPARAPDAQMALRTLPQQALLYRLNGDMNPLHADPAVAAAAGFDRPILHGLCTYGLAARAVMQCFGGQAGAERLARLDVRFSQPVFPGERLRVRLWQEADGLIHFDACALPRNAMVLSHGVARLSAAPAVPPSFPSEVSVP
ncbi:MaoC family dehydratase [Bordetella trematum]|uniref:MaoC family dehydratase n=1 Tax=Bordetella trematum TaxID=123899 RepID=UPI0014050F79|nr:MaoC family dehydratase [Bordetella trematum]QIM72312.1 MaoC family dehydratase [Bordetella trematum]